MAVQRFPDLMNHLIDNGRSADTPVAIIENGTTPRQRVIRGTLGQLTLLAEANKVAAPAMLIVGEVAALGAVLPVAMPHYSENYAKPDFRFAKKG
jgi:uroporphyrin-III C-methyltransferase/precorrin-2 dehydrogenase/sirohydrochlorin ferrochelatase